ncbi:MAG: hypothetical protein F6J97_15100 [Leptolyngbya sp. SIO4C1]|nr:hypothetical protein [Leptolyngbya sp. SIO4C1]
MSQIKPPPAATDAQLPQQFQISLLIRTVLLSFYTALVVPLPFLAQITAAPVPSWALWASIAAGAILLYGSLSERVDVSETGIQVTYPSWIRWLLRRGWALSWSQIEALKPRSTGQGGLVYYFLTPEADRAYLLPMRVAGFAQLVRLVEAKTGIDTRDVRPLSQPWMYFILLGLTLLLGAVDLWTIGTALSQSP